MVAAQQKEALQHIRVLDLSRILAGPWAAQLLADLGADVIKVEKPRHGDDTRGWGPPWVSEGEAAYFSCANHNKRSISVDITQEAGQTIIKELVKHSDILLENFKVGGLQKYGLDYDSLKNINPKLIYCSITGFGQSGPYKHRAGYDFMIQAMGGLMSVTGVPDGQAGGGPQKVGVALADIMTGLYASNACLAALAFREQTGLGQHIDMSLLDVQIAALANQAANYLVSGQSPVRLGNAHPNIVPYQAFASADGYFILAVGNDEQFARLSQLLKQPQWLAEDAYRSNAQRVQKRQELLAALEPLLRERTTEEWINTLEQLHIPCGPINTIDQALNHEHIQARGLVETMQHSQKGEFKGVRSPIKMSASPLKSLVAPPSLGEHTYEVLKEYLQWDDEKLDALQQQQVI